MYIYVKYFIRSIFSAFILSLTLITALILILYTTKLLFLIEKGIQIVHILELLLLLIPYIIYMILPVSILIAIIYVYHNLNYNNELSILFYSGLSNFAIAKPAIIISGLITIFGLSISGYLLPTSYKIFQSKLDNLRNKSIFAKVSNYSFHTISKNHIMYINRCHKDGILESVILFDNSDKSNEVIFFAKTGKITSNKFINLKIELHDGIRQSKDITTKNLSILHFQQLFITIPFEMVISCDDTINIKNYNIMYINELLNPSGLPNTNDKTLMEAAGHQRILWPIHSHLFTIIAVTIILNNASKNRITYKIYITLIVEIIIITFIYFSLQKLIPKNPNWIIFEYIFALSIIILGLFRLGFLKLKSL
ncbi:LptF/LptG family permease [Rickettsia endosymbiont of Cardiosporidium cionae]|uniref:LptF/LptG family permease n=1 Tax=Rickettsia endosymbiont of Cardiosporidium cionae TaxID=2777155 RepID=UPI001895319D|nr:LptF/LptG family permease [Rickettsia endosymbiont of Cardiosporidium cionae]KAF8818799.1 LptF/LptG family permease [Rickettsia endosymbiont of Cardiosporidium cionae]